MNSNEIEILTRRLIPRPRSIRFSDGEVYVLKQKSPITVEVADKTGIRQKTLDVCKLYWNIKPVLKLSESAAAEKCGPEAYQLSITEKQLKITARDWRGAANAFKTLRQLAEAVRGTEQTEGYLLAPCKISDKPALQFRGIHICIFPETPLWDVEKQIRLAAYYKYNHAVIECWGCFPFASHPEICWGDRKLDKTELKRLVKLGKELGITLIPQFNVLGHAAGARGVAAKHSVLDYNPALQPLFEPEGWTWCLTNPHTRKILGDLVTELHDFFDNPPFFHIGCDEAHDAGSCYECRKHALKDLIRDHILFFHDIFKKRNTRLIMWHDMLLEMTDERWKGYIACAMQNQNLANLYKELPKDIVIADWQYFYKQNASDPEPEWPTSKFFKKEKFNVLTCPWKNTQGIESLGKMAEKEKLFGMLETTWHISHTRDFLNTYLCSAYASWSPEVSQKEYYNAGIFLVFASHIRQIIWDMGIKEYEKTGSVQNQVNPGHYPHADW